MKIQKVSKNNLSVIFKFSESGRVKAIFLNAETDRDQAILEKALDRLIKTTHFSWLRRLFQWK
jgi:hypothetical protein